MEVPFCVGATIISIRKRKARKTTHCGCHYHERNPLIGLLLNLHYPLHIWKANYENQQPIRLFLHLQTTTNSRSILFIFCISSSKPTSFSELSKGPATRSLVIIFGIRKQQVIKVNIFSSEMSRALLRSGRAT